MGLISRVSSRTYRFASMKITDLCQADRERIAKLIKELSNTAEQLENVQQALKTAEGENVCLKGKLDELEGEREGFKKCIRAMESDKLEKVKEYETGVKELLAKMMQERGKKETVKKSLGVCERELQQLSTWNKKLQADFIELQQLQIQAQTEAQSRAPSIEPNTPRVLEIPKLAN